MEYSIRMVGREDARAVCGLIWEVYRAMPDKTLFALGEEENLPYFEQLLSREGGGCAALTPDGEIAGVLITRVPGERGNLGADIGLPPEEQARVIHMEYSVVAPAHRGHGLERRLLEFLEEREEIAAYPIHMCTVSPYNPASLRSVLACGYEIAATKEKYGGVLRHILIRRRTA